MMRLALCNEVLGEMDFASQCAYAAALGYDGLELAPFTIAADPTAIAVGEARRIASIAADHGIAISGLHWLLVAPGGLSITTEDAARRARTIDAMKRLVDLCAALGGRYLVHGSPAQRMPEPGQRHERAFELALDCWMRAAEAAAGAGVVYCIEPLSPDQTPLLNTLAEALTIVENAGTPALRTMLDTSSASQAESMDLADLVDLYWPSGCLAHVQLNDRNRRGPGQGRERFAPVLGALARHGYDGWIAVEPFDYWPDRRGSAAFSAGYVRGLLESLDDARSR